MSIEASLAGAPIVRRGDYAYVIHPLLDGVPRCDPALLREAVAWCAGHELMRSATLIVAPEAMALPIATGVSLATGIPFVVARKRSYGLPGELIVPTTTGYGATRLHINDVHAQDRVVLIDDIASTGGTLGPLLAALRPRCQLLGALVLVDKGITAHLEETHHVPVRAKHRLTTPMDHRQATSLDE